MTEWDWFLMDGEALVEKMIEMSRGVHRGMKHSAALSSIKNHIPIYTQENIYARQIRSHIASFLVLEVHPQVPLWCLTSAFGLPCT